MKFIMEKNEQGQNPLNRYFYSMTNVVKTYYLVSFNEANKKHEFQDAMQVESDVVINIILGS